jgi:hypothetical protein
MHHSGEKRAWEAGFFGRSLRLRIKVSDLYRPESPVLRAGVSAQKISNIKVSEEFSPKNCNEV